LHRLFHTFNAWSGPFRDQPVPVPVELGVTAGRTP
jgi:hypothetical protein